MVALRICKYNPANRDKNGCYTLNDWTEASDIGKVYNGKIVTIEEYLTIENKYIKTIKNFIDAVGLTTFVIKRLRHAKDVTLNPELNEENLLLLKKIKNNMRCDISLALTAIRLTLRNQIGCHILGDNNFYVAFSHDLYVFLGFDNQLEKMPDLPSGIYVDEWIAPYWIKTRKEIGKGAVPGSP